MEALRQAGMAVGAVEAARCPARCPRLEKEDTLLWTTAAMEEMRQVHSAMDVTQERTAHGRIGADARAQRYDSPLMAAAMAAESGDGPGPCKVNVHIRLVASNGVLKAHAVLTNAEGSQFDVPTTVEWADFHSASSRGVRPSFSGSSIRLDGSFLPLSTSTSLLTMPPQPTPSDAKGPTTLTLRPTPSPLSPTFPTAMQQQTQQQQVQQQTQLQSQHFTQLQSPPPQPNISSRPQLHPPMLHSQYGRYTDYVSQIQESPIECSPCDNRQLDTPTGYSSTAQDQPIEEKRAHTYPEAAPHFAPRPSPSPSLFPIHNTAQFPDVFTRELAFAASCAANNVPPQDIDHFPTTPNNLTNASFPYTTRPPLNTSIQEMSHVPSHLSPHSTIESRDNASNAASTNISLNYSTKPSYFTPAPTVNQISPHLISSPFITPALSQAPSHARASSYPHTTSRAPIYDPEHELPLDANYSLIQVPSTHGSTPIPSNAPTYVSEFSTSSLRNTRSNFIPNPTTDFVSNSGRTSVFSTAPRETFVFSHPPAPILPISINSPNPNPSSDAHRTHNETRDAQLSYNIFSQNSPNGENALEEISSPYALTPWRESSSSHGFQAPSLSPTYSYYQQSPRWIYHKSPTCHSGIHIRRDCVEVYPPREVQSSPSTIRVKSFNHSRRDAFPDTDARERQNEQNGEAIKLDVLDTLLRKLRYIAPAPNEKDKTHQLPDAPILPQRSKTEPVFFFSELASSNGISGHSNSRRPQKTMSQNRFSNNPFLTSEEVNNPNSYRHQSMFTLSTERNETSQTTHHPRLLSASRNAIITFNNIFSRSEERNDHSLDKDKCGQPLTKILNEYSSSSPSFSSSHMTNSSTTVRSPGEWALVMESPSGTRETPERLPPPQPPQPPWLRPHPGNNGFSPFGSMMFDTEGVEEAERASSQNAHQGSARMGRETLSVQDLRALLEGMRARNQATMREMARVQQQSALTPAAVRARTQQFGQTQPTGTRPGNDVTGGAQSWGLLHPYR